MASNLVPSKVGPQERTLDQLFTQSSQGLGPILNQFAQGNLPQSMRDWITGTTNEQFGGLGARFGTDLGTAISRGLGLAGAQQAQWAMGDVLGLGKTTAGFEFQRSKDALDRALQEWVTSQQGDLTSQILQSLLGGGLG